MKGYSFNSNVQGASAVLCYEAIEAPLAQPRALIGGHFISALVGICITKLFGLLPSNSASTPSIGLPAPSPRLLPSLPCR